MATVRVSLPAITVPRVDPETGLPNPAWYFFDQTMFKRTGGVEGDRTATVEVRLIQVEDAVDALEAGKADKTTTITAGNGLDGGGDLSADRTIDAKQDTGWTAGTGTANKGAFTTYNTVTISNPPTQAEVQALADALQATSRRALALEQALRNNEGIN